MLGTGGAHSAGLEDGRFVQFAGDSPFSGEVDENWLPLLQFGGEALPSKFFPAAAS